MNKHIMKFARPALVASGLSAAVMLGACERHAAPGEGSDAVAASAVPIETPGAAASAADAFLVLPGDYAQSTTVAELEARFGKANVRTETEPEPRLVLFPNDPARRAFVTFHDPASFRDLASITVTDPGSRWRGKQGVEVGMSFAKVRELNGKPFGYSGFDAQKRAFARDAWSLSMSDEDGSLGAFDVGDGDHLYFDIDFGIREGATVGLTDLPIDGYAQSDEARFPQVGELAVVTGIGAHSSLDDEWE